MPDWSPRGRDCPWTHGRWSRRRSAGEEGGLGGDLASWPSLLVGKAKLLEDKLFTGSGNVWQRIGIRGVVVASSVLEKWELRPRNRLRTSCNSMTVWPTSRKASTVVFIF